MIVLVCGGVDFARSDVVDEVLSKLPFKITLLVHGAARGADMLAALWAMDSGVEHDPNPPDWLKYKEDARFIRNSEMLVKHDIGLVIAFPGGKGTADMKKKAGEKSIEVLTVKVNGDSVKCFSSFSKEKSCLLKSNRSS